ncbi:MAG: phosphoribosylformylglycinamidine synthase I [Planctomycetes bacterium]|nr:phosphoribosylformylglycinamidine synthase I [Planctomycetota bacterium]
MSPARKASRPAPRRTRPRAAARRPRAAKVAAPRVLVLRAAGTNCDRETAFAFEQAGAVAVAVHVNELARRPSTVDDFHGLVIPGGFSHGDDLGAGTVLGTRIRTRLVDGVRRLVDRGGIVLGICNGFQVLVKTGLVPGFDGAIDRTVTLAQNLSARYEDRWVTLEVTTDRSVFLRPGERYRVPVAHAEGRLLPLDESVRARLHADGQVALRYVGPDGGHPAPYPWNPNGAVDDIAGITDPTGRILGLMPHPERHQFPWQSPTFHRDGPAELPDGLRVFLHAVEHLRHTF